MGDQEACKEIVGCHAFKISLLLPHASVSFHGRLVQYPLELAVKVAGQESKSNVEPGERDRERQREREIERERERRERERERERENDRKAKQEHWGRGQRNTLIT